MNGDNIRKWWTGLVVSILKEERGKNWNEKEKKNNFAVKKTKNILQIWFTHLTISKYSTIFACMRCLIDMALVKIIIYNIKIGKLSFKVKDANKFKRQFMTLAQYAFIKINKVSNRKVGYIMLT